MSMIGFFAAAAAAISTGPVTPAAEPFTVDSAIEMAVSEREQDSGRALPSFADDIDEDGPQGAQLRLRMLRLKLRVPI